jgi:hypothetical protein
MSNAKIEVYAAQLEGAKTETLKRMAAVPEEGRLAQFEPGKATPLWLVGHLAGSANTLLVQWLLNQSSVTPEVQGNTFMGAEFGGQPITANAGDYPAWDDLVGMYEEGMTKAVAGVKKLDDSLLAEPLPGDMPDDFRSFFSSIEATLQIVISHDAEHRGQLGMIAKYGK